MKVLFVASEAAPFIKTGGLADVMGALPKALQALGMEPVIHAQTALGEGTGGVLLLPLLDMALRVYNGPHTFSNLGMDAYTPQEGKA